MRSAFDYVAGGYAYDLIGESLRLRVSTAYLVPGWTLGLLEIGSPDEIAEEATSIVAYRTTHVGMRAFGARAPEKGTLTALADEVCERADQGEVFTGFDDDRWHIPDDRNGLAALFYMELVASGRNNGWSLDALGPSLASALSRYGASDRQPDARHREFN